MTSSEFKKEYDKLKSVYPIFANEFRESAVFSYVHDLDYSWWAKFIRQAILSSNPKLDIYEAAGGERRAKKSLELTRDALKAADIVSEKITEPGFNSVLENFNADSLWDAVIKKPRGV